MIITSICAYKFRSVAILIAGLAVGLFLASCVRYSPQANPSSEERMESESEGSTVFDEDDIESSADDEIDEDDRSSRSCRSPSLAYGSDYIADTVCTVSRERFCP